MPTIEIETHIQLNCSHCGSQLIEYWPEGKDFEKPDGILYTFKILPCSKCLSEIKTEDCIECERYRRRADPYCRDCGRKLK